MLSRDLLSCSFFLYALFAIVHKDFATDTKHQSGPTGKLLAPQLLPPTRRDPPVLVLHETAAKKLTHSYDGVGVPYMGLDMPVLASAKSPLFLPVLHPLKSLVVLVQAILDIQNRLPLRITASYFLEVDPSVKRTVTIHISQHGQAARWPDTSCPLANF